ncbi:MAG: hypothetical protein R6W31_17005 [Bacteroidales bacterium]
MNRLCRIAFYGTLLIFFLVSGCNRQVAKSPAPDAVVIFPPPPATTRIQFLTHFSSSDHLAGRRSAFHRFLLGDEQPLGIIKPYGVTIDKSRIYICDTGLAGLEILDLEEGTFEYFIPAGKGQLKLPVNCCVDENGRLYVADANRQQIVLFDSNREYLHAFGEKENFKPTDVEVFQGKVLVSNVLEHSVCVYDADNFELLEKMAGQEDGEDGFIRKPTNMAIHNSTLYVSDFGDFNVKKFSMEGEFVGSIGGYGNLPGMFTRPKGVALDREGNLYVVDAAFENVQIFNPAGELLMHFGGSYQGAGAMWLPAAVEISYENLSYFEPFVDEGFRLKYIIYVTNQYGPAKLNVYGFVE